VIFNPFVRASNVRVVIPRRALEAIFDECDLHNTDETGGRLVGTYCEGDGELVIKVSGVIEPGPAARRSNTSFFHDGDFQESVFRTIERAHPEIEHLGNWHTHHVNGYPHLSGGDISTYTRTVNHEKHNTSFFYALLVTARESARSPQRYRVKHYLVRRGGAKIWEIDSRHVDLTDGDILWPTPKQAPQMTSAVSAQRAYDVAVLGDFYQGLRAFASVKFALYWRGVIDLIDGTTAEVLVVEEPNDVQPQYVIGFPKPPDALAGIAAEIGQRRFASARAALITAERECNRAIFLQASRAMTI
jgi:Prokaryotic homologs of the JAB domain